MLCQILTAPPSSDPAISFTDVSPGVTLHQTTGYCPHHCFRRYIIHQVALYSTLYHSPGGSIQSVRGSCHCEHCRNHNNLDGYIRAVACGGGEGGAREAADPPPLEFFSRYPSPNYPPPWVLSQAAALYM